MSKKSFLGFFFGILILSGASFLLYKTNLTIKFINISGERKYTKPDIIKNVLLPHVNTTLYNADLYRIQRELKDIPWIQDVSITRLWPNKLLIRFVEKDPIAIWNAHWIFDKEGRVFFPENMPDLPIPSLEGPVGSKRLVFDLFCDATSLLAQKSLKLKQLRVDSRHSVTINLQSGVSIKLGKNEPIMRLRRFLNLYNDIMSCKKDAETIDLRYPKGVAVKWKE